MMMQAPIPYDYYKRELRKRKQKKAAIMKKKARYSQLKSGLQYQVHVELDLFKGKEATAETLYKANCEYRRKMVESEYNRLFGKSKTKKKDKKLKIDYSMYTRKYEPRRRKSSSSEKSSSHNPAPADYLRSVPWMYKKG